MNKLLAGIVVMLFLVNASAALWTEHIIVYAYDRGNRGIPGVEIEVKYQKDKFPVTSKNFDGTLTGTTNPDGAFQATFYNQVYAEEYVIREYVVFAKYLGKTNSTTVKCLSPEKLNCSLEQPKTIALTLPVYRATVRVTDQHGFALKDALVMIGAFEARTDDSGKAFFELPEKQSFEATAVYGGLQGKVGVKLAEDANVSVVLPLYDVVLRITDENGNALDALVSLGNESKQTQGLREMAFNRVALRNATLTVEARGKTKEFELIIDKDLTQEIVFDGTPPKVENVEIRETSEGKLEVTAIVVDEGIRAAGLKDDSPVAANYSTGGAWSQVEMYPLGGGQFKATLQKPRPGETIRVKVIGVDREGNVGMGEEASFRVKRIGEQGGEAPQAKGGGFEYWWVIAAIIIGVIAFFVFKKFKEEFAG